VLERFLAGSHRFQSERNFAKLTPSFQALRTLLLSGGKDAAPLFATNFHGASLELSRETVLRHDELFSIQKASWALAKDTERHSGGMNPAQDSIPHQTPALSRDKFLAELRSLLSAFSKITSVELQCTGIQEDSPAPGLLRTKIIFAIAGEAAPADSPFRQPASEREIEGVWQIDWTEPVQGAASNLTAQIAGWQPVEMLTVVRAGPLFTDVTAPAFGQDSTYPSHLLRDTNYWRAVLDSSSGIDIFGNCGVSVADVDGDGKEEIYLCQPQGLPNRLYRQRQPGVFEEFTAEAGVDLLDSTSMAIFADVLNRGCQDLIAITESAPLLFVNDGRGRFKLKPGAFPPSPSATSLTGAAMADYDRDGYLDLYVCAYGYFQGQGANPLPSPYYDAQNGPPNYLYRNLGNGSFEDVTTASGLDHGNNRFSFGCAWVDFEGDGWPDLCVINDFGRNNFYRNRGDGTFEEIANGIPGQGSGMSACAADFSGTGREELYVGNMWTPAGMRVTRDPKFAALFHDVSQDSVRQFAMGNALYRVRNDAGSVHAQGDHAAAASAPGGDASRAALAAACGRQPPASGRRAARLEPVFDAAGARRGRWAWCSDSFDLENDGWADLYVANGFLTEPEPDLAPLDAFLWEEVVASTPHSSAVSNPYRAAWTAIFQLAHQGHSWNGKERNVLFRNLGHGQFADVSAVSGIDFLDDGRSFAVFDFDGDGGADIVLHSRTGPQLRLLKNDAAARNRSLAVRLTGTKSNRDAVGARVEMETASGCQTRSVTCGSGFLAQHSKELIFGLEKQTAALKVSVRWPSGAVTELKNLEAGYRYFITEGQAMPRRERFSPSQSFPGKDPLPPVAEAIPQAFSAALVDPLPLPPLAALNSLAPMQQGSSLGDTGQRVLLWLVNPAHATVDNLRPLLEVQHKLPAQLVLLGETSPPSESPTPPADLKQLSNPPWKAGARFEQFIQVALSYLFDYRRKPPSPTGMLVELSHAGGEYPQRQGPTARLIKVYWGGAGSDEILRDARQGVPSGAAALPFPGRSVLCSFARETRALGAALAEAGLYAEAEVYLAQAAQRNAKDADTLYNLALVRRELGKAAAARENAEQALALRPEFPEADNLLGVLLIQTGDFAKAERFFQRATAESPGFAEAWNNLGYVQLQKGDLAAAEKSFNRTLELAPDFPDALNNFGILLARRGNLEKAAQEFAEALRLQPANEQAANNLGVVYFHQGKPQDARRTFLALLEHNPEARSVLLNLVKLDLQTGKQAEAAKILQSWIARHPGDDDAQALLQKNKNSAVRKSQ
jgi:Flp pilus assembly protein TadD